MLTLTDVSLSFHRYTGFVQQSETQRLCNLNLTVMPGELIAIVGASGAGKSLLAHAILGLLPPNATLTGKISFNGESLVGSYPKGLRGRKIALMPQDIGHLDPLAKIGAQLRWASRRVGRLDKSSTALLEAVGLPAKVANAYPRELSGGMARRVLIALSLVGNPDLIVADEPTAGLDPENSHRVLQRLRDHAREGRAAMVITHDLMTVLPFADRVVILDDGKLTAIEQAGDFEGEGFNLRSLHARALWAALPQNGFWSDA